MAPGIRRIEVMRKNEFDQVKRGVRSEDSRFIVTRSPFYQTVRMLARYYARMNSALKPFGTRRRPMESPQFARRKRDHDGLGDRGRVRGSDLHDGQDDYPHGG